MPAIRFTQFLRPDGRRRSVETDVNQDRYSKWVLLRAAGYNFEIEELRTLEISMEVCRGEESLATRICENGPPVVDAVNELVDEAFEAYRRKPAVS